jgi:hypothetical protein
VVGTVTSLVVRVRVRVRVFTVLMLVLVRMRLGLMGSCSCSCSSSSSSPAPAPAPPAPCPRMRSPSRSTPGALVLRVGCAFFWRWILIPILTRDSGATTSAATASPRLTIRSPGSLHFVLDVTVSGWWLCGFGLEACRCRCRGTSQSASM